MSKNSETARAPLSGTHLYKEPLDAERIGDPRSSLIGCNLCGVARKYLQSEGGCNSTLLNVGNDIFGETPRHQERGSSGEYSVELEYPQIKGGCHSTSLNAGNGIVNETPRHQESDSPDARVVADKSPNDEFELSNCLHRMSVMTSALV